MRYIHPVGGPAKRDRPPGAENLAKKEQQRPTVPTSITTTATKEKEESPPKRMKTESGVPSPRRAFGEQNSNSANVLDTSHLSVDSKDTNISHLTLESSTEPAQQVGTVDCGSGSVVATPARATTASSVQNLRGWLDEFGKQNQKHYEKQVKTPSADELAKPVMRPKVRPSVAPPNHGPTPLPTHAAHAFSRRMSVGKKPHHPPHSNNIHKRVVRLVPKPAEQVQATNEGYASVAQLSKWLADDPTSTKKVKQIRRGANIIAKSRKFDKNLENVVVEEERGSVLQKRLELQKALSEDSGDKDHNQHHDGATATTAESSSSNHSLEHHKTDKTTIRTRAAAEAASLSVSEKKKWLSSAFHSSSSTPHKAVSEIHSSSSSHYNDASLRAKDIWRHKQQQRTTGEEKTMASSSKSTVAATSLVGGGGTCGGGSVSSKSAVELMEKAVSGAGGVPEEVDLAATDAKSVASSIGLPDVALLSEEQPEEHLARCLSSSLSSQEEEVDFRKARELLVQRSKANGNDVEIRSKPAVVQQRKTKFEELDRQTRRKSGAFGLLKPSWEEGSAGSYTKTYHEDIAPKKSLEDLP